MSNRAVENYIYARDRYSLDLRIDDAKWEWGIGASGARTGCI